MGIPKCVFGVHAQASSLEMVDCVSVFFSPVSPASGGERVKQTRPSTHEAGSYEGLRAGSREGRPPRSARKSSGVMHQSRPTHSVVAKSMAGSRKPVRY